MAAAPFALIQHSARSGRVPTSSSVSLPIRHTRRLELLLPSPSSCHFSPFAFYSTFATSYASYSIRNLGSRPSRCALRRLNSAPLEEAEDVFEEVVEEDVGEEVGTVAHEFSEVELFQLDEEARNAAMDYSMSLSRELRLEGDAYGMKVDKWKGHRSFVRHIPDHLLPRVTIVGRPNVGKSALFNRLVGGDRAIVVDEPGVTRDRLYGRSFWGVCEFMLIDTGGVMTFSKSRDGVMEELAISTTIGMDGIPLASREAAVARMPSMIEKQAAAAVEEASVIIFLVDGQAGLTVGDEEISDWLRKNYSNKSIILAVNKCESPSKGMMQVSEFWSLGFTPMPISAISGTGTGDLLKLICSELPAIEAFDENEEQSKYVPSIAIVGKPNVGKSSILNALVGEDRTIVSPISGTTRDAIDIEFTWPDGQKYKLIDTAGIRRRAAVASGRSVTEALSVNRAFRTIRRSDVVALVIEAMACITEQDCRIAERIEKEGKGCIIVVNKWDTVPKKNHQTTLYYEQDVREKLRMLSWAPIVYSTALNGHSVDKIIDAASLVERERSKRLSTSILNQVVREAVAFKPPPRTRGGRRGRVYYSTQAAIRPPTFVFFVNDARLFPETYRRYMEKQLRSDVGFPGTPIRLLWRSRRKTEKEGKAADTEKRALLDRDVDRLRVAT